MKKKVLSKKNITKEVAKETTSRLGEFYKKTETSDGFIFYDAFKTNFCYYAVLVNKSGTRILPVLIDPVKFTMISGVINGQLNKEMCGFYTLFLNFATRANLFIDCVMMTSIDILPFPICNFFIKEQGTNNVCDDLSKMLILPSDAVFMSLLLGVSVYLSSESVDRFSIRIAHGMTLRDAVTSCMDVLILSEKKS